MKTDTTSITYHYEKKFLWFPRFVNGDLVWAQKHKGKLMWLTTVMDKRCCMFTIEEFGGCYSSSRSVGLYTKTDVFLEQL